MSTTEYHGPIDFLLLEFPGDRPLDETAGALMDLVERGTVAIYDLVAVRKAADGSFEGIAIDELGESFAVFEGARSGLLGDDDLREAAEALEPGTVAALIVFENTWAVPFVSAELRAGGLVAATARIPAQDVMDALDALEAADQS
jgi:dihydroorotase-like cyclic amidohydrolase